MANEVMNNLITTSLPYNKEAIVGKLAKLDLAHSNNIVTTSYDARLMKTTSVSDKYFLFDFPQFVENMMPAIENYINPSNYKIHFSGGRQEIRLIGDKVEINGDVFYRMLSILNSTDKSRSLQMNMGLLRLVCTNGMFASVADEAVSIRGKHFKASLPEKIETFTEGISRFVEITNNQTEVFANLIGKTISYRELANLLIRDQKTQDVLDWKVNKLNRFAHKLLFSQTDRLADVTLEQRTLLESSNNIIIAGATDIEIPAYQAVNCWTEIFRSEDSSKMKRESQRILSLVDMLA